ncbi:DUF4115 domain-containing protein [Curvibacter sp. RS43]|uniref:helix-turn-helix domain-containing protein n=1 Tax=Curvibacter microcysteis TaxID=3026419 RepID=UPI002361C815|nr:RodZ domain-containing protein [Curvibacter sp. RS43]MDD0809730.1 DUF4115 domain-containing protein [Curvibacter sp. RS43]
MSELELGAGTPPVPQASAGQLLKQAREAAGMHVAALAVALKVPVSKLEALEADRFDQLPDAVFVRALASSVCRSLRVDAAPILALLPQTQQPRLNPNDAGINTPFRAPHERRLRLVPEQWFNPTLLAVPLLCVGALAIYLWPRASEISALPDAAPAPVLSTPAEPASPEPAATPAQASASPEPAAVAAPGTRSDIVSSQASSPPASAPPLPASPPAPAAPVLEAKPVPVAAPAAAPIAAPAPAEAAAPAAASVLSFSASGTSWIKVTDARGTVTLQKTLSAGETATATGQAPFAVVVGKVDVTQLQVRGQPFDLQSVARENVARFEVK